MMKYWRVIIVVFCSLLLALFFTSLIRFRQPVLGFTFSAPYVEFFDLDPVASFQEILSEFPAFSFVRIPVYWDRYESLNNVYTFEELDRLLETAERHDVGVILAIGQKVPRWPECYDPSWTDELGDFEYRKEFLSFISEVAERYGGHPALSRWQVENETYFPFGDCEMRPELIPEQMRIVRGLDVSHPVQTTISGEQGISLLKAFTVDIVGMSLYRTVKVPGIGQYQFPHTPFFYRVQGWLARLTGARAVISELQAEPWGLHEFDLSTSEGRDFAYHAFSTDDLQRQLDFAHRTGLPEVSLWGPEWWLALLRRGDSRLWDGAKSVLNDL